MTEQDPGMMTPDEQAAEIARLRAALAATDKVPYTEAAGQVAEQVDQGPLGDAGAVLGELFTPPAPPLPHEAVMDQMMAEFKAMSERVAAMESELGKARKDYAAAAAKLGPPEVATYARNIHAKLVSYRNAHPDAPAGHFDAVIAKAAPLAEAAQKVIDGEGHVEDVTGQLGDVTDAVDRFVTRSHRRTWGKPIDFSALESDLEYARDSAAKLQAAS